RSSCLYPDTSLFRSRFNGVQYSLNLSINVIQCISIAVTVRLRVEIVIQLDVINPIPRRRKARLHVSRKFCRVGRVIISGLHGARSEEHTSELQSREN